jgi:hypothetical protein
MMFFNIDSFTKYGIEVRMNKIIALIFGVVLLSSCSRSPTEIQIKLRSVLRNPDGNIISYSGRSIDPSTGARGSGGGGFIALGSSARKEYFTKVYSSSRTIFVLMTGSFDAEIKLLVSDQECANGVYRNSGPPKQVRLECRI